MSFFGVVRGLERKKSTMASKQRSVFSSKTAPRGWYKGRGVENMGFINNKGKFIMDKSKLPQIMIPDLTGFDLKPYVSFSTPRIKVPPLAIPEEDYKKMRMLAEEQKDENREKSSIGKSTRLFKRRF